MFYVISMLISDFPYVECSNRTLFYTAVLDKHKFVVNWLPEVHAVHYLG